ncbi:MAG: hypothetical protein QOE65_921 [Solirubrobacteraceae bacterium]|jgi:hypothetical protein|nr:hypothetical protein [Solirubrobacteraceae bacterium]
MARRGATLLMSGLMVALGVGIVARALVAGGGPAAVGVVLGILFAVVGAGRLYVETRR